jgi:hypothetical protein
MGFLNAGAAEQPCLAAVPRARVDLHGRQ